MKNAEKSFCQENSHFSAFFAPVTKEKEKIIFLLVRLRAE